MRLVSGAAIGAAPSNGYPPAWASRWRERATRLADGLVEGDGALLDGDQHRPRAVNSLDSEASRNERVGRADAVADRAIGGDDAAATVGTGQDLVSSRALIGRQSTGRGDQFGDPEGEVDTLAPVEAWIAHRLVAVIELVLRQRFGTSEALGDVVAGELDMDAAGPGAFGAVGADEPGDLAEDVVEVPGLAAVGSAEGVGVHRVARPDDRVTGVGDGPEQRSQTRFDGRGTHPRDQREPARAGGRG